MKFFASETYDTYTKFATKTTFHAITVAS